MTLHTNQPFNDILFDRLFAQEMKRRGGVDFVDAKHAFKRVAVVGMLFPTQPQFKGTGFPMMDELLRDDKAMVHQTLKLFSNAGIPTSPNAEFDVYNLLPPIASDFLQSANPLKGQAIKFPDVDLVVINYVPIGGVGYTPLEREYCTSEGYEDLKSVVISEGIGHRQYRSVSRWNEMCGIWSQASFNVGAKFITTHGGYHDEVNTQDFEGHDQSVILRCTHKMQQKNRKNMIYSNVMGVVANAKTLTDFVPHAKKNSAIGAAIHKVSQLKVG